MRQMVAVLVALAAGAMWLGSIAKSQPPPVAPPGGIQIYINQSHCYTPRALVPIRVENLTPGSLVQASSSEGVIEETLGAAKAASNGVAKLIASAPSALPSGRRIEAHLIKIEGTDATGRLSSGVTAFVLATRNVCKGLNERH